MEIVARVKDAGAAVLRATWSVRLEKLSTRIIYYHSVGTGPLSTPPSSLDQQLGWMRSAGIEFVTLAQVPELIATAARHPWVCVTFDDGYADNRDIASEILKRHGVRATFFVVASYVGDTRMPASQGHMLYPGLAIMDKSDVAHLAMEGHEIASHGLTHHLATEIFGDSERSLVSELASSRNILSEISGQPIYSYAYPNGQNGAFSHATRGAAVSAGFTSIANTIWGSVSASSDPQELPRCRIDYAPPSYCGEVLQGRHDYIRVVHRLRRHPTWPGAES